MLVIAYVDSSIPKATTMPKGKRLCSQARAIILSVYNYFAQLKKRGGGRGPLKRTSEATDHGFVWCRALHNKKRL